jgi:hypothetical protein
MAEEKADDRKGTDPVSPRDMYRWTSHDHPRFLDILRRWQGRKTSRLNNGRNRKISRA